MAVCRSCRRENRDSANFCRYCGARASSGRLEVVLTDPRLRPASYGDMPRARGYAYPVYYPKDWLVESILVTLFCFLPFGIVGIVYAAQARSSMTVGDWVAARSSAGAARAWVIASFCVGIAAATFYFLVLVGLAAVAA